MVKPRNKTIYLVDGWENDNPREMDVSPNETVRQFKLRAAKRLGVDAGNTQLALEDKKLLNEDASLYTQVNNGDSVYIEPRSKGG